MSRILFIRHFEEENSGLLAVRRFSNYVSNTTTAIDVTLVSQSLSVTLLTKRTTVSSGRLHAGNLLILTQNVSSAGDMAVQVIC